MHSKSATRTLSLLLFLSFTMLAAHALPVSEVWIDDDFDPATPGWGVTHFDLIQDGIDAVWAPGTVHVMRGTYYENLFINKQVTLLGEDKNDTIIDGGDNDSVVKVMVNASNSIISGFTIRRSGTGNPNAGILINYGDYVTVSGNIIKKNYNGIYILNSIGHVIENNDILNTDRYSIYTNAFLEDVRGITIRENTISQSAAAVKVLTQGSNISDGFEIFGNSYVAVYGYFVYASNLDNSAIYENEIEDTGTIWLVNNSSGNTISNNIICLDPAGTIHYSMQIKDDSSDNIITHNFANGEIHVSECTGCTISHNVLTKDGQLELVRGGNHEVSYNTFYNVNTICIWSSMSVNNTIVRNHTDGSTGIYLSGTEDTLVSENLCSNNSENGIALNGAYRNTIVNNIIADNANYGIYVKTNYLSMYNEIYGNSFINNAIGNAYDSNEDNDWFKNLPAGGNYWSDYTGEDLNGDGFGDTPYYFLESKADNYPLMAPPGGCALWSDTSALTLFYGGTIDFSLHGGAPNADRLYLLLGSMSGTEPGMALPGGVVSLPLNWDAFTDTVFANLNTSLFHNFMGTLDATGSAEAQLDVGPIPAVLAGITLHFAFTCNNPFDIVSNAVPIEIIDYMYL